MAEFDEDRIKRIASLAEKTKEQERNSWTKMRRAPEMIANHLLEVSRTLIHSRGSLDETISALESGVALAKAYGYWLLKFHGESAAKTAATDFRTAVQGLYERFGSQRQTFPRKFHSVSSAKLDQLFAAYSLTQAHLEQARLRKELLDAVSKKDVGTAKRILDRGADPNFFTGAKTPLIVAIENHDIDSVSVLLSHGAEADCSYTSCEPEYIYWSPLHMAITVSTDEIVRLLLESGASPNREATGWVDGKKDCEGFTPLMLAAETGKDKYLRWMLEKGADFSRRNSKDRTALHYGLLRAHSDIVKLLLSTGADPNIGTPPPIFIAAQLGLEFVRPLLEAGAKCNWVPEGDPGYFTTPLMAAVMQNKADVVKALMEAGADSSIKDSNGWTAERHAESRGFRNIVSLLNNQPSSSVLLNEQGVPKEFSVQTIVPELERSLFGLVGTEWLLKQLALDLVDFVSGQESRARLFWGSAGTGKTEVAQRLAGLRQGYPPFRIPNGSIEYVSGVDGRLEIKSLVDQLKPKSVVFVDEADKCLDPAASMVTKSEAVQLHHAIVTHFSRKPIYWVFVGTFSAMRGEGPISDEILIKTLGSELASRIDFIDWRFPDWTVENLLRAVRHSVIKRGLSYDDDALLILCEFCMKKKGGVRAFDNLDLALSRRLHLEDRGMDQHPKVTANLARKFLASLGYRTAA